MRAGAGNLEDVLFVESTIELCEGRPSDVERQGIELGGGRLYPWSATVIRIDGDRLRNPAERRPNINRCARDWSGQAARQILVAADARFEPSEQSANN